MAAEAALGHFGEQDLNELDFEELKMFLAGAASDTAEAAEPAAAPPAAALVATGPTAAAAVAAAGDSAPEVQPSPVPLPPGFEEGPNIGTYAVPPPEAREADGRSAKEGEEQRQGRRLPNGNGLSGLVGETSAKVVVEHEDHAASHLCAAKSWDELNLPREVLDGIFEMGFVKPSKIQEWALPVALKGGNIIGQAQNGSGKTAAFSLAMLMAIDAKQQSPQGVCVCPTRELASQNHDVVARLGKFTGVELFLAVPQEQRAPRKVNAQVVVGTPGKLQDLIKKRVIEARGFRVFVLDEADVMVDEDNMMGPQVLQIRNMLPKELQVLLFSATWPERVEMFARRMVPSPHTIRVQKEDLTLATISQKFIDVGRDEHKKSEVLSDLYGALNIGQSVIFVNTRVKALALAKAMKAEGHAVSLILGTQKTGPEKIDVAYRDRVMSEFRSGVTKVLIATDVLARGIDVPAVTMVVNYELPLMLGRRSEPEFETYMHRIGRTGRFGLKGVAVNLVATHERPLLSRIESFYKCTITQLSGDCEEMEALIKGLR